MPPLAGTITEGKGLAIGYFAQQELDVLRPQDTPLEHMIRLARELGPARASRTASRTCATSSASSCSRRHGQAAVGSMSGGEKARLVLAMIVWQRPNLLLLDEPTNHLDLATREALSVALNEFEGTVMLVSHDRALLRSVCDEFWLVGRGAVAPSTATSTTTRSTCWRKPAACATSQARPRAAAPAAAPGGPRGARPQPATRRNSASSGPAAPAAGRAPEAAEEGPGAAERRMAASEQEKGGLEARMAHAAAGRENRRSRPPAEGRSPTNWRAGGALAGVSGEIEAAKRQPALSLQTGRRAPYRACPRPPARRR
jgi:ATP-binding cassette subfamily F protein 3